jgi:hypothetical protein
MATSNVSQMLKRFETLKTEKQYILPEYKSVSKFVNYRQMDFTTEKTNSTSANGAFITAEIFDSTAAKANSILASALIGTMWPNGAQSVKLTPPMELRNENDETSELKEYFKSINEIMVDIMDNPKAGLATALEEYMHDQGSYGTSGIFPEEVPSSDDWDVPIRYTSIGIRNSYIGEGKHGMVDSLYTEKRMTLHQAALEYGEENLCKKHREKLAKKDWDTAITVLHVIEPRKVSIVESKAAKHMPVASVHICMESKKILRESGYNEMPAIMCRFYKREGEVYARSPAMDAIPTIIELEQVREAEVRHVERGYDPATMTEDDAIVGGMADISPGANNSISRSGRIGGANTRPIEIIDIPYDMQSSAVRVQELTEAVKNHFFLDRLMDLNNETRMTLGEANIRNDLRGQSLSTVNSRQITELFVPLIERTFNILFRRGYLGVIKGSDEENLLLAEGIKPLYIPDVIAQRIGSNKEAYRIEFISPAIRMKQAQELMGIESLVQFTLGLAQAAPAVLDTIDTDYLIERYAFLAGTNDSIIRPKSEVKKLRTAAQKRQEEMMKLEASKQDAEATKNYANAASTMTGP